VRFVLASGSPARLKTLRAAGVEPEVIVSGVDESAITADSPRSLVQALASAKARSVAAGLTGPGLLLGCDSMLQFDNEMLGKPGSAEAAVQRWKQLRGRSGVLHTGHSLIDLGTGDVAEQVVSTEVNFADLSDEEIQAYVATGEPLAVAGAFTIDGLGGWYIESIKGDHHNVVGLSLPALRHLLAELGYRITDLPSH
jgi:septum formation protein